MNIKNIIGLGLLTYFTSCNTPPIVIGVNNQPANCVFAKPTQNQPSKPEGKPAPIVRSDVRPQLPIQTNLDFHFHVRGDGRVEKSIKQWVQDGESHETL